MDSETKQVVRSLLELIREQAIFVLRQESQLVAIAETIAKHPQMASDLKQHPLDDPSHRQDAYKTELLLQKVDELIQRLKD